MTRFENRKPRILFVGEAVSLAHVTRPLVLAQALDRNRYEISFACGSNYRKLVADAGHPFHSLHTLPPELFLRRLELGAPLYDRQTLARCVEDELKLFAALQPDLIVGDFRVSLGISALRAQIPYVNICNAHWSPFSTLDFPVPELPLTRIAGPSIAGWLIRKTAPFVFPFHARAFNSLRKEYGLLSVAGLREMYTCGTWTLYLDIPGHAPTTGRSPSHRYLGPPIWYPSGPLPPEIQFEHRSWPLIYVTLGSSGDTRVLNPLIDVLRTMPVNAVVSTAGRIQLEKLPAHIVAVPFVPAKEILKRAAVCVFNGGSATGYQALAGGVPLLAFPSNADQFYFSQAVERVGAGLSIRPSTATVAGIATRLQSLLGQSVFRDAARRLQRDIDAMSVASSFREFIQDTALPGSNLDSYAVQDIERQLVS
jgi:UDP:flavonoid glycosyltransferase YjiC (YdhE family)